MLASALRLLGPNFDVHEVLSAEEGFLLALRDAVDLLVIDVLLPGISGLELVEKVQACNPQLKIILITGAEDNKIRQQVAAAQVDAYFYKPIVMDNFIRTVLDCLVIEREDLVPVRTTDHAIPSSSEATPVFHGTALSLMERLNALCVELKAFTAIILDRGGRVLAQSGSCPLFLSEPESLPLLVDVWHTVERFSATHNMELPANMLWIAGQHYHLILTQAGKPYLLIVVISGPRFRGDCVTTLKSTLQDLVRILSSNKISKGTQDSLGDELIEMKDQTANSDMANFVFLLEQLGGIEAGDEVDAFWDRAVDGDKFRGVDSDSVLSYDQACMLGLVSLVDEQSDHQDGILPDVSEG